VDELETDNEKLEREFDKLRTKYETEKKEMIKLEKENE
jgi:hypothetical protein